MKTFNFIFTLLFLFVSFSNADVTGTKIQGPALIEGFNEVTSAAGTTTLTKDSQTKQILTGTTTQTFVLPDATTLPLSRRFLIINKSTGTATIQTSGGGALTIVSSGLQKEFHLRAAGSAAGTWDVLEGGGSGGAWGGITGTLSDQTDLQTALDAKAPTASPTFTGTIGTPLTASRALVTDASGNLSASSTTSTALGYLDVSSSLTTLLAAKAPLASPTFTGTIGTPLTASKLLATDASGNLTATAANSSQATYLDLTSSAQTQLNAKLSLSNYSAKGDLVAGVSSGTVAGLTVGSNGKVLTADSNATNGLRWDDPKVNKNYVTNGNAEGGVSTGWSTYADASGTSPVDCTGGSPNSTWAASSSSAIHGSNNFLATLNTGASRQGEGVSYAFTVDSGDSPATMSIRFYYKVAGGTFAAGNDADKSSAGDSDFTVWIYDVTNGTLIQPYTYRLYSNSTTVSEPFVSNFQTNSNSTSYRLCIHKGTSTSVSGTAITVRFDDFEISRSNIALNTPISDWVSYTPTTSWVSNATITGRWRRVGDSMDVQVHAAVTGTPTSADFVPQIPSGYTIDTAKLASSGSGKSLGYAIIQDSGTRFYTASVSHSGAAPTTSVFVIQSESGNYGITNQGNPITFGASDSVSVFFTVPITGWSSSVQQSDGWDARQIVGKFTTPSGSPQTSLTTVNFGTSSFDVTNSYSAGTFTIPTSGYYKIFTNISINGATIHLGDYLEINIRRSGSVIAKTTYRAVGNYIFSGPASVTEYFTAGQTVDVQVNTSGVTTPSWTANENILTIEKLSSPQTVSMTDVVAARYTTTNNQSLTGTATTIVNYEVKTHSTHDSVTVGAGSWNFRAPISGLYKVQASIRAQAKNYSTGDNMVLYVYKNGSEYGWLGNWTAHTNLTSFPAYMGDSDTVQLNAGDTLDVRIFTNTTINLDNNSGRSHINIERIK